MSRLILAPILIFASFVFAVYFAFPQYQKTGQFEAGNQQKKEEIDQKQVRFFEVQKDNQQLAKYAKALEIIGAALPENHSLPYLFQHLQTMASANGLSLQSISQDSSLVIAKKSDLDGEEKVVSRVNEYYVNLQLAGSFTALENFLRALEKSARLFQIETIAVVEKKEGQQTEAVTSFNLTVKAYSY